MVEECAALQTRHQQREYREVQELAISDAQRRAVAKYNAANYDRVELRLEKGKKDVAKAHAEAQGESLNAFINRAINETMERDGSGKEAE